MMEIDCHLTARPILHQFTEACGDTGVVRTDKGSCFLALIDALGHGDTAGEIADMARRFLGKYYQEPLPGLIRGLHRHLTGTRGAVAALCRLDIETGVLQYCGMGNIRLKRFGSVSRRLVTKNGIIGYRISTPQEKEELLKRGDLFIMYSDGLRNHFDPIDLPVLTTGTARQIAEDLITHLGKPTDDASCIVLRYGKC